MTSRFHAVVWIDHREARVFHFDREGADKFVIHPHNSSVHLHHKANSLGSGHAAEDKEFLSQVAAALAESSAILITGPANAKTELVKYIHKHQPKTMEHIRAVESADHLSDNKIVAHAREYFRDDREMLPRIEPRNTPKDVQ